MNLHNYVQPSMIRQPSHLPYQPQQQPQPQQQLLDQVHIERKPTTGFTPQPPPLVGHPSTTSVNKYSPSIKSSPRQAQLNKFENMPQATIHLIIILVLLKKGQLLLVLMVLNTLTTNTNRVSMRQQFPCHFHHQHHR